VFTYQSRAAEISTLLAGEDRESFSERVGGMAGLCIECVLLILD
jgi:hypothetical protein